MVFKLMFFSFEGTVNQFFYNFSRPAAELNTAILLSVLYPIRIQLRAEFNMNLKEETTIIIILKGPSRIINSFTCLLIADKWVGGSGAKIP